MHHLLVVLVVLLMAAPTGFRFHLDDPAHPDSWASKSRSAQHVPKVVGTLSPDQAEQLLLSAGWNAAHAKRQAARNEWVVDENLRFGSGLYYGPHDPKAKGGRIHLSPQYRDYAVTAGHEAQHSHDHESGLMDDYGPLKRDLKKYADAPGRFTVFGRQAQKALTEKPEDTSHYTTGVWERTGRDPKRFPPELAERYWPFITDRDKAGSLPHRVLIPSVPNRVKDLTETEVTPWGPADKLPTPRPRIDAAFVLPNARQGGG